MKEDDNTCEAPFKTIPIAMIEPDGECIRRTDTDIRGLKYTITDVGLLQPILARKAGDRYTVIDGHRRLRALRELGVTELIIGREVIVTADERDADNRYRQIIANIQREDIGDIELGHAFVTLKHVYGYAYNEIAEIIGKDRHYVTAKVGLATRLAPGVRELAARDMEASPGLYTMNINILESIARLPEGLQMDAYRKIRAGEMDKAEAFKLIRSIKNSGAPRCGRSEGGREGAGLYRYVKRVHKELDMLAIRIKEDDGTEKEKLLPAIESLIERLNCLRSEITDDRQMAGEGEYEARIRGAA